MMRLKSSRKTTLGLALALLALASAPARAQSHYNETFSVDGEELVDPGSGETIVLSGDFHSSGTFNIRPDGSALIRDDFNYQGIVGIGEQTGTIYHLVGAGQTAFHIEPQSPGGGFPLTVIEDTQFLIVAPGPGNNFVFHLNQVYRIDADGTVTLVTAHFFQDER